VAHSLAELFQQKSKTQNYIIWTPGRKWGTSWSK